MQQHTKQHHNLHVEEKQEGWEQRQGQKEEEVEHKHKVEERKEEKEEIKHENQQQNEEKEEEIKVVDPTTHHYHEEVEGDGVVREYLLFEVHPRTALLCPNGFAISKVRSGKRGKEEKT